LSFSLSPFFLLFYIKEEEERGRESEERFI